MGRSKDFPKSEFGRMAGAIDERVRAFDVETGRVLWETKLPTGGNATPAVFEAGGRACVLIAAGGCRCGRGYDVVLDARAVGGNLGARFASHPNAHF